MERCATMVKVIKKCAAVACYVFLLSFFFEVRIERLFDGKQFLIWVLGTGLMCLPSFGEKGEAETWGQRMRRISQCGLFASFLESFLLCLTAMERMRDTGEVLPELALCLRPVLYGICVWTIFAEQTGREKLKEVDGEKGGIREISASESYIRFAQMGLTKRECEIAILICQGMSNGEIAENLCISEATVKKHISNIFEKFNCSRREQIRMRLFS